MEIEMEGEYVLTRGTSNLVKVDPSPARRKLYNLRRWVKAVVQTGYDFSFVPRNFVKSRAEPIGA